MALIKFGGGVVGMAGSIAGTTFARNRYGSYARARTKPINRNTPAQQTIRSALSNMTTYWAQTLTDDQRAAWNLYGANVTMLNRLGESVNLSGFNHFIRSNVLGQRATIPVYEDGPVIYELPEADPTFAVAISEATQEISITFDDTADWDNETGGHMFILQGTPQNPQRNFFNGPWLYAGQLPGETGTPLSSPQVKACSIVCTEDQRVWVYARIQRADGRLSEPFRGDCFVGA